MTFWARGGQEKFWYWLFLYSRVSIWARLWKLRGLVWHVTVWLLKFDYGRMSQGCQHCLPKFQPFCIFKVWQLVKGIKVILIWSILSYLIRFNINFFVVSSQLHFHFRLFISVNSNRFYILLTTSMILMGGWSTWRSLQQASDLWQTIAQCVSCTREAARGNAQAVRRFEYFYCCTFLIFWGLKQLSQNQRLFLLDQILKMAVTGDSAFPGSARLSAQGSSPGCTRVVSFLIPFLPQKRDPWVPGKARAM